MGSSFTSVTINGNTISVPNSTYGNFRYSGLSPSSVGMDEDYDACDLENWFLAIQSADGQVTIPSFHRPGIVRHDTANAVSDWSAADRTSSAATFADSASRILRPVAADGNDAATFPDLIPDPGTGKMARYVGTQKVGDGYDVDNDGDGQNESVWVDLGYPARRDSRGQLYKPLFAFMVIGLNGRIPLNTAGNLAGNSSGYGSSQAEHLGNSVSEVDPTYALQNTFNPNTTVIGGTTYSDQIAAYTAPQIGVGTAPNAVFPLNSQVDTGGIDVRLTQLRICWRVLGRNLILRRRASRNTRRTPIPTARPTEMTTLF